jgi:hypothetical protein
VLICIRSCAVITALQPPSWGRGSFGAYLTSERARARVPSITQASSVAASLVGWIETKQIKLSARRNLFLSQFLAWIIRRSV